VCVTVRMQETGVCSWVKGECVVEGHVGGRRLYSLFGLSQFQGVIV